MSCELLLLSGEMILPRYRHNSIDLGRFLVRKDLNVCKGLSKL